MFKHIFRKLLQYTYWCGFNFIYLSDTLMEII